MEPSAMPSRTTRGYAWVLKLDIELVSHELSFSGCVLSAAWRRPLLRARNDSRSGLQRRLLWKTGGGGVGGGATMTEEKGGTLACCKVHRILGSTVCLGAPVSRTSCRRAQYALITIQRPNVWTGETPSAHPRCCPLKTVLLPWLVIET